MRIGLFGGSFDPVHNAHLALAQAALSGLGLDRLRWVPTGEPWHKATRLAPAGHRAAMVELAIDDAQVGDRRFVFEGCELARPGPSYTIDTVEQLQAREPGHDWWLLIGQDQHASLHTWHRWRDLLGRVGLAVAARPGAVVAVDPEVQAWGHRAIALPPMAVSSTQLRHCLAHGMDIGKLVPAAVAGYIDSRRLYRERVDAIVGAGAGRHQPHRS